MYREFFTRSNLDFLLILLFKPFMTWLLSQDCEDFDKKVEKLQSEKERRMEECSDDLRGLEDGYRQKHRDAKQVT